jgi:hypothetical protein
VNEVLIDGGQFPGEQMIELGDDFVVALHGADSWVMPDRRRRLKALDRVIPDGSAYTNPLSGQLHCRVQTPQSNQTAMTEIQYELRERDLLAFNDHQLKNAEKLQKTLRLHQATIPGFYYQDSLTAATIGGVAAFWGLGAPYYLKWITRQRIARMYSDEEKARILGEYTLRIEPHDLVEISKSGESRIKWADVLRIEAAKNYAFVFVALDSALIIPRQTVKKGDILEFFKEADQHIEKAS